MNLEEGYKRKRNKRGSGSIRKTKTGKYEYRFPYLDEYHQSRIKSVTCATVEECVDAAERFKQEIEQKGRHIQANATIGEILREKARVDHMKNYTNEQGYARSLETIKIIERQGIGMMKIGEIEPYHIDQFLTYITRYSDKSIAKIYSALKSAFELAQSEGVLKVNYMKRYGARRPKSSKPTKKVRALTIDEQIRLMKALEEHKPQYGSNSYKLQILIELYSGMRMGEINALRPEDIDFKERKIHVHSTIARGLDFRPFLRDGTKTQAGDRYVPISDALEPALKQAIAEMKENPAGLIFYDHRKKYRKGNLYEYGGLIETTQVNSYFKRVCKNAGIQCQGQHSLRHTFATRCIEAGIKPVVLQKWLGHTDIHMTIDTYTDVFDRLHNESMELFDKLVGEIKEKTEAE